MTPEAKLKYDCRGIARINKLIFWSVDGKGIRGVPDTLCGHTDAKGLVLIEFKHGDGELSEQQKIRLKVLEWAGQRTAVCRSVDDYRRAVGLLTDKRQPVPGVYGDDL